MEIIEFRTFTGGPRCDIPRETFSWNIFLMQWEGLKISYTIYN